MGVDAWLVVGWNITQAHGLSAFRVGLSTAKAQRCRTGSLAARVGGYAYLLKGIPLTATRTFANPFRRLLSAV